MKKLIYSLFLILLAMTTNAQTSDHYTFEGIPMYGTLEDFAAKIEALGYQKQDPEAPVYYYKAKYMGYDDCVLKISLQEDSMWRLYIYIKNGEEPQDAEDTFYDVLEKLKAKLGEPFRFYEVEVKPSAAFADGLGYVFLNTQFFQGCRQVEVTLMDKEGYIKHYDGLDAEEYFRKADEMIEQFKLMMEGE